MFQQLLLAIIIGLAILRLVVGETEGFTNPSPILNAPVVKAPAIPPPPPAEDDPRDLPWISSWSSKDHEARAGQNCITTYAENGPDGTMILTTNGTCEAGMPHTRAGDRIVMPDSVPLNQREETIQHELIHIYQRRNPSSWITFYRRGWSFIFYPEPPEGLPLSVVAARRSNPDTWDPATGGPWVCWQGRYWPIPVYTDPAHPVLREAHTVWWDSWQRRVLLEAPATWRQFFGTPSQEEHPHELAAVMIVGGASGSEAGRRVLAWWNSEGRSMNRVHAAI
jgi:hypothetical protein